VEINIIILTALVLAGLWTVMTRSLLRSAIGLALVSAILTMAMFRLHSPLAAVFELSVCTGLISVLFVSTISLTQSRTREEIVKDTKDRITRYWYLPVIIVLLGIWFTFININLTVNLPGPEKIIDVRYELWNMRPLDIIGQIIIILAGAFGVVLLFKERKTHNTSNEEQQELNK
jgi:NADH-quinone oxidoreductase subunit J